MKKHIIALTFVLIISSLLTLCSPALDDTLTEEEAKRLIHDGYKLFWQVHDSGPYCGYINNETKENSFHRDGMLYFEIVPELLIGGSYEGLCAEAEKIFTADKAADVYQHSAEFHDIPIFYFEDGHVFMNTVDCRAPGFPFGLTYSNEKKDFVVNLYGPISINGDIAEAKVFCYAAYISLQPVILTCEFRKTADGWRISGGEFYKIMTDWTDYKSIKYELYTSPATGDEDVTRAAVFSVSAVLALCALVPTFCSGRKRRKIAE